MQNMFMKIYDQHVHSYYSYDSNQPIEEYVKKALDLGLDYFVLTDHIDLNHVSSGKDLDFDIFSEHNELDKLSNKYPNIKFLKGVEIGYRVTELSRIKKLIKENRFDLVNFSVHENEDIDYYYREKFLERGVINILNEYFDKVIEALNSEVDFDVLCHFDFGFKTAYLIDKSLKLNMFEDKVVSIFKKVIELDKCLEINVKVQTFISDEHTTYLLNLYKKLGGENITLSSDAHEVARLCDKFDHYLSLIKNAAFDHVNYFIKRKRFDFKI